MALSLPFPHVTRSRPPLAVRRTSASGPPLRRSRPRPPTSLSAPAEPFRRSAPPPPLTQSSPSRPSIVSSPPRPLMRSPAMLPSRSQPPWCHPGPARTRRLRLRRRRHRHRHRRVPRLAVRAAASPCRRRSSCGRPRRGRSRPRRRSRSSEPSAFVSALKIADDHWFAFSGVNHPACLKSTVPSGFSTKSITCVPCEYQAMKIRFSPGIWWNTCAVQTVAAGLGSNRRAEDRLLALGGERVGLLLLRGACRDHPRRARRRDRSARRRCRSVLSTPGAQLAPGGRTPPPRSSVAISDLPDALSSASWLKARSSVESKGGMLLPPPGPPPWW